MNMKKQLKLIIKKVRHVMSKIKKYIYNRFGPGFYINKGIELFKLEKSDQAIQIFKKGLRRFPNDYTMVLELNKILVKKKEWQKIIDLNNELIGLHNNKVPARIFIDLSKAYQKIGYLKKAENTLSKALRENQQNKKLLSAYTNIIIKKKDWSKAVVQLEKVLRKYKSKIPMNICIKLSMIFQVIGNMEKASKYFNYALDNYGERIKNDKIGYRKLILFDNGESRIEFYKKLKKTEKVIITFDSINMVWKNPPFGYKLLSRQNLDIIAVRKRKKQTYQQDLTQEDFYNTVSHLVKGYKDKIAYGFSLGAYTSLYFSSLVDCRILAISPRLSIHPVYGRKKVIPKYEFKHNLNLPYNEKISPIIVYDPKNKLDNNYINLEVRKAFPNAEFIKIPYGGHGMAPHLSRMGLLKEFVLTVIYDNGLPVYDRKLKSKSSIYFRLLGNECLKRNKLKWAEYLVEKSLALYSTDILAIKLKINLLKRLGKYEDAIDYISEVIKSIPKNLSIRIMLIELYIETDDMFNAERELNKTKTKFSKSNKLAELEKTIKKQPIK